LSGSGAPGPKSFQFGARSASAAPAPSTASALARLTAGSFDADRAAEASSDDWLRKAAELEAKANALDGAH